MRVSETKVHYSHLANKYKLLKIYWSVLYKYVLNIQIIELKGKMFWHDRASFVQTKVWDCLPVQDDPKSPTHPFCSFSLRLAGDVKAEIVLSIKCKFPYFSDAQSGSLTRRSVPHYLRLRRSWQPIHWLIAAPRHVPLNERRWNRHQVQYWAETQKNALLDQIYLQFTKQETRIKTEKIEEQKTVLDAKWYKRISVLSIRWSI